MLVVKGALIQFGSGCRDIDECSEGGKQCGANTDCINTDGSHHCVCQIGFEGNPCEILIRKRKHFKVSIFPAQTEAVQTLTSVNISPVPPGVRTSPLRTPRTAIFLEISGPPASTHRSLVLQEMLASTCSTRVGKGSSAFQPTRPMLLWLLGD